MIKWHKISFAACLLSGIILIVAGVYFMLIAYYTGRVANDLNRIKTNSEISYNEIENVVSSLQKAAVISRSGDIYYDLAIAQFSFAEKWGFLSGKGSQYLNQAEHNFAKSVEYSPAKSNSWRWLAYARMLQGGGSKKVSDAVYMAMITEPYGYRFMVNRLNMAIISWKYFSDEQKETVRQQVRIAWAKDNKQILKLAASATGRMVIAESLQSSPEDMAVFDEYLVKKKWK